MKTQILSKYNEIQAMIKTRVGFPDNFMALTVDQQIFVERIFEYCEKAAHSKHETVESLSKIRRHISDVEAELLDLEMSVGGDN